MRCSSCLPTLTAPPALTKPACSSAMLAVRPDVMSATISGEARGSGKACLASTTAQSALAPDEDGHALGCTAGQRRHEATPSRLPGGIAAPQAERVAGTTWRQCNTPARSPPTPCRPPANPPYVIVATGCPTARPATPGAAAATTPTASNPASNGSRFSAAALLPKYLGGRGEGGHALCLLCTALGATDAGVQLVLCLHRGCRTICRGWGW